MIFFLEIHYFCKWDILSTHGLAQCNGSQGIHIRYWICQLTLDITTNHKIQQSIKDFFLLYKIYPLIIGYPNPPQYHTILTYHKHNKLTTACHDFPPNICIIHITLPLVIYSFSHFQNKFIFWRLLPTIHRISWLVIKSPPWSGNIQWPLRTLCNCPDKDKVRILFQIVLKKHSNNGWALKGTSKGFAENLNQCQRFSVVSLAIWSPV